MPVPVIPFSTTSPWLCALLAGALLLSIAPASGTPLTLAEVDQLALDDPAIRRFQHLAEGLEQDAVAARQLPDPQLSVEMMQFPLDRPGFSNDPMTMVQVGLRQTFPRGQTRSLSGDQGQAVAARQRHQGEARSLELRAEARSAYLQRVLAEQQLAVLRDSRGLFEQLLEQAQRSAAAGLVPQQDVLRAGLELERLEDRIGEALGERDAARTELARWIGNDALRPLPEGFPELPQWQQQTLTDHPRLAASRSGIQASEQGVALAEQAFSPQWSVQLEYGLRTSSEARNRNRLAAMVSVDLPLFTAKRQDRRLSARQSERDAALMERDQTLLELTRERDALLARWQQLKTREARFNERLLDVAQANAEAAEQAYGAGTLAFTGLMEARLLALETHLDALRLTTRRMQIQVQLLSLLGESTT